MTDSVFSILAKLAEESDIPPDNLKRDLSAAKVKAAKSAGKVADGGGLLLFISPSGGKTWRYRFRLGGKEQTLTIGQYPEVGLADARSAHRAARWLVERGTHPLAFVEGKQAEAKAQADALAMGTFRKIWERFDQASAANLAPRTVKHRRAHLDTYILPTLGDLQVTAINRRMLADLLGPIDRAFPATAKYVRLYVKQVLDMAVDLDMLPGNPTPKASALLNGSGRKATPRKALPVSRLGEFLLTLEDAPSTDPYTKSAMRLLILTWARTSEAIGAEWAEFDLDNRLWRIPAERMKGREPHTVYLSNQAVKLLRELALISHGRFLFPNRRRPQSHMSRTTLTQWRNRFGFTEMDIHGFRAVASTWANESGKFRPDVIEVALSHKEQDRIRAAYNRAQFTDELRTLWQAWADFLDEREAIERGANVIQLDTRKAG